MCSLVNADMFKNILQHSFFCQKINSRNAFGLHLIDYMVEMLRKNGEMTNFQVNGYHLLNAVHVESMCALY